jgi:hypothetical protein
MSDKSKWNDEFLNKMRTIGDPFADNVVAELFDSTAPCVSWEQMMRLDTTPPNRADLPASLRNYLSETDADLESANPDTVGGRWIYENYRAEMFFILAHYSLPASYAAEKGVKVLHRTFLIEGRPDVRLSQTARIIEDILSRNGIRPGAPGMGSIQKVRLIHAAIRLLILRDKRDEWQSAKLGVPINQEDLAGTLIAFSYLILDGFRKLGITVPENHQESFIKTWGVIGRLMGIQDDLIPATVKEAKLLAKLIEKRQVHDSEEGKCAVQALLKMLQKQVGIGFEGWPAASMRFFLPRKVAVGFGIPFYWPEEVLLYLVRIFDRLVKRDNPLRLPFVKWFGNDLINQFVDAHIEPYKLPGTLMGRPGQFRKLDC